MNLIQIYILYYIQRMSAFKKKIGAPEPIQSIEQKNKKLNLLLGLGSSQQPIQRKKGNVNRQLILACAMFWDSKKRIDKIKSLILKQQQLQEFNSTQDFQISQLMSIQLLSLSKNNIMHLQPLSILDTLVCLNINHNRVYDLSPLSQLIKLQQLYASNNQITHIDPLKPLSKLRILNLYSNKINRLNETITILVALKQLQELDIQQNPVYLQANKSKFLALEKLIRFNGNLILEEQRANFGIMSVSSVILPAAKFRDTHTSFFGSNKSQVNTEITGSSQKQSQRKIKSKKQIASKVEQLQRKYLQIDDKFEQQIVKNVQLKSSLHKKLENKKILERKASEIKDKQQQITQLKRKVKMLKENLFNNPESERKGELLRELFDLEMMKELELAKSQEKSIYAQTPKSTLWVRKFDYDEQIFIGSQNDDKYLMQQDQQIAMLLTQNNSALQQLKRELREMTDNAPN